MLKADLHLHTSEDLAEETIKHTIFDLIDHLAERDFDVLAVTAHNLLIDMDDAIQHAAAKGMVYIPGIECDVDDRHVVILNADKEAESIRTFADLRTYRETHPDCFVFAPHPYYPKGHCLRGKLLANIDLFDGIEYCHFYFRGLNFFNHKAVKVAEEHGKTLFGTSDAHNLRQIDYTYTLIDAERNVASIIRSLKEKKVEMVTRPLPFIYLLQVFFWALISGRPKRPELS